jgi:hypothetical protein
VGGGAAPAVGQSGGGGHRLEGGEASWSRGGSRGGNSKVGGGRSSKMCPTVGFQRGTAVGNVDTRSIGSLWGPVSYTGPMRHSGWWQRGPSMAGGSHQQKDAHGGGRC